MAYRGHATPGGEKMTVDLLFDDHTMHVEVRCWSCNHCVTITRGEVKSDMDQHDFERRAVCGQCKTTWPHVQRFPRKPSTSM